MRISIITLFPEIFQPILNSSIIGRAQKKGLLEIKYINLRDFGIGLHQQVDDKPFGGGVGMVLKVDVLASALEYATKDKYKSTKVILTTASGKPFNQQTARNLAKIEHLVIVCGHYEGVDQRFIDQYVDEEISIGDYVLTGGEIPAMVITDTIGRLLPGVLEKEEATINESFTENLLEYPQYTRPADFQGQKVPEILISGNHQEIDKWRKEKAIEKTTKTRPDLLDK